MRRSRGDLLAVVVLLLAVMAGGTWLLWQRCGLRGCPDVERLRGYVPEEASVVVDREGREVAKLYRVRRVVIPLDSLPEYVPVAFVAVEDQRFWEHGGVDWTRVLGAAWANIRAAGIREGFSTITMQLARNVFPERLPFHERTLSRKLAEVRVAREIEARYTKEQILELYLNQIYFGNRAWGIEAATREYFDKSASELTLDEAALLAGLIRSPNTLNPRANPAGALARRAVVLQKMVDQGMITPAQAVEAAAEPLELSRSEPAGPARAPYFLEEVRRRLEEALGEALYTEGYTVHTTLDPEAQRVAEEELESQLAAVEAGRYGRFRPPARPDGAYAGRTRSLQGAVAVLEAATGNVLALVGGRDFLGSEYNRATQARRQPGSAFKPFVYTAALAAGYPPTHPLSDEPLHRVLDDGTVWAPRNFEGSYGGTVTLRSALVQSRNVATIRLAEEVGLGEVVGVARRLGLGGPIPAVPSIAIGAAEVTLLELTAAYAAFATLGKRPEPRFVTRVESRDGRVIWRQPRESRRVLDPAVAFLMTDLMRDVVDRGTGTAVRAAGFRGAAAGKTGTTNDATDVWFIGFTPRRVAGVWIGFDRPRTIVPGATGGRLAAPVWGRIMRRISAGGGAWAPPSGIETRWVDAAGGLVSPACVAIPVRKEYFLAGTAPHEECGGYGYPAWPDSVHDSADVLPGAPDSDEEEDERWWSRLRRRIFGSEPDEERPGRPPGPAGPPPPHADTLRTLPPTTPAPQREEGDRPPRLLGRPAPPGAGGPAPGRGSRDGRGRRVPRDTTR